MSLPIERLIPAVQEMLELHTDAAKGDARRLLLEIEGDLALLPTVPLDRQPRFLRTMEKQVAGFLELQRIKAVRTSQAVVASTIITLIRAVLGFL